MIGDFEFELEYGDQIEKARSVRNELIGLLEWEILLSYHYKTDSYYES